VEDTTCHIAFAIREGIERQLLQLSWQRRHTPLLLIAKVMKVMLFHRETSQCEVHYSVRCNSNVTANLVGAKRGWAH